MPKKFKPPGNYWLLKVSTLKVNISDTFGPKVILNELVVVHYRVVQHRHFVVWNLNLHTKREY